MQEELIQRAIQNVFEDTSSWLAASFTQDVMEELKYLVTHEIDELKRESYLLTGEDLKVKEGQIEILKKVFNII